MPSTSNNRTLFKRFYKNRTWKNRFFLSLFFILLILIMARLLLPQIIIYSATSWLKQHNIEASIESININLLQGNISLINAQGNKNGEALFTLGRVDIHWHWTPLTDKTLAITSLALDQLSINIEQYNDAIIIGGITLPLAQTANEKNETTEHAQAWTASLGQVVFSNFNICYLQHLSTISTASTKTIFVDYCMVLSQLDWHGNIHYAKQQQPLSNNALPVSGSGSLSLNELTITDNKLNKKLLSSQEIALSKITISSLQNISIKQLTLHELSVMQRDDNQHQNTIHFDQLTLDEIKLQNLNTLFIDAIEINEPGAYLVKNNQSDWEFQQWIPSSNTASNKAQTRASNKQNTSQAAFSVAINSLSINNADLCYRENNSSIYYCYHAEHFFWQGELSYDSILTASGTLSLSHLRIHNHILDRNLIKFNSLTVNQLDMMNTNNIRVGDISLNDLHALQRSEEENDSSLSFDSLVVKNIHYTPGSIKIDSTHLDGLASYLSKNKEGKWEHSKWLTQQPADKNSADESSDTTNTEQAFTIALHSILIETENKMLFTDHSTEPATHIGLQKLSLNISDLDSTKPDRDTLILLSAQTTRHGTINIEGSARPFAEKISFDATGKIKGFDLRVASPASKKAIGHIIHSGQLDADLTLFAKEGVLDSHLALSLHHFNIKPISKKDSDALDARFGIPLNKTLVLLRDKDDSIHLNIPVTGDVSNPDFSPTDAIIKATAKAATVTLITFYTPYGLIFAGGNILFDLATALNFDPVEFDAGSAEILDKHHEQLDKLAKLMSKKPQIRLTLCGLTNTADLHALHPALATKKDEKQKENTSEDSEKSLNAAHSTALFRLAQSRQNNIKDYLIKHPDISHDRLILCAPKHQTQKEALAAVEINI